jgi:hypothetical protein
MEDAERFRLLGKYKTPRFRIGQRVLCEVRGEVTICGLTDAPIPWPMGKAGRQPALARGTADAGLLAPLTAASSAVR